MASAHQSTPTTPTRDTSSLSLIIHAIFWRFIDLALAPLRLTLSIIAPLVGKAAPPTFHILLLSSLIPLIAFWSFGAGLVIRSWIPTGWKEVVYLQYGTSTSSGSRSRSQNLAPYADLTLPALVSNQPYDICLELVLPHFAKNSELGNFMTSITIKNPSNVTLAHSTRPSLIFPPNLALYPFIASGALSTYSILIPLAESFSASSYLSSLRAHIRVGRNDGWKSVGSGQGRELVIVEAFARGIPKMTGLRGFFARHSILLVLLTTTFFFVFSSLTTVGVYLYFAPPLRLSPRPGAFDASKSIEVKSEASYSDIPLRIKEEEPEEEGSSAGPSRSATQSGTGQSATPQSEDGEDDEGSGSEVDVGRLR